MRSHPRPARRRLAALTVLALSTALVAASPSDVDRPDRVGVLIADHGEPPEYNEDTYYSFRAFFRRLMELGVIPPELALVDTGTVAYDRHCPGCDAPSPSPGLVDAWLHPHDAGPAAFVPASQNAAAHYVVPGGPGLGEPDIFEQVGLQAWHEWEQLGGRSPNSDQKRTQKDHVLSSLRARYGADVPVRVGYGIDPRIGGASQGLDRAVTQLVNRDRVTTIVVAYHGVGFSDIMQTHMIRARVDRLVERLDADVEVRYTPPIGVSARYVDAVAQHVAHRVAELPPGAPVAVHLSEHGLPTSDCGSYDCGGDGYHAFAAEMFARTREAILDQVSRPGRLAVHQVYGDGGADEDDPDDLVDSPVEALEKRAAAGYEHVIDVPYAFSGDSRDTLIVLRHGYERPVPDWDEHYESRFVRHGMDVQITNASFAGEAAAEALTSLIVRAVDEVRTPA